MFNSWNDISLPSVSSPGALNLGAIPADQDNFAAPRYSQVCDVFIQPIGADAPFIWDGYTASTNNGGVDNTNGNNQKSIWLTCQGGLTLEGEITKSAPKQTTLIGLRTYALNVEVEVTDESQRNLLRQLMSGWNAFYFWYATLGGMLFGGPQGIKSNFVNATLPQGEGDEDFEVGNLILRFETKQGAPPRTPNPLQGIMPIPPLQEVLQDASGNILLDASGNTIFTT